MSAVLRGGAAAQARRPSLAAPAAAVRAAPAEPLAPPKPEPDPRDREIERLQALLAQREGELKRQEAALAKLRDAHADALAEAFAEGEVTGRAAAERDDAARCAAAVQGIDAAKALFAERLAQLDRLAPELTRRALARLVGTADSAAFAALVRTQVARLGEAVVEVKVSPDDFPALGGQVPGVAVDPALASGVARIECRLGALDLSFASQAAPLAALLEQLAG